MLNDALILPELLALLIQNSIGILPLMFTGPRIEAKYSSLRWKGKKNIFFNLTGAELWTNAWYMLSIVVWCIGIILCVFWHFLYWR